MTTAALVLLAVTSQAKKVTVTTDVAQSTVVLEQLGKAAGVTMKPMGSVLKDVIFVRFNDTPLEQAMQRVAKTLHATWEKKDDGTYLLMRTQTQDLQSLNARSLSVEAIAKSIDEITVDPFDSEKLKKSIEEAQKLGNSEDNNVWDRLQKLDAQSPMDRFGRRLVKAIGADVIASVPEGETIWFAPNPTRRQRAFPPAASAIYQEFLAELRASKSLLPHEYLPVRYYSALLQPLRIDPDKPLKFGLSIERNMGGGISAISYFQQAEVFDQRSVYINSNSGRGGAPQKGVFAGIKDEVKLSDELKDLVESMSKIYGSRGGVTNVTKEVSDVWRKVFDDPAHRDFTTILSTDFFRQSAESKQMDMVAVVPDLVSFIPVFAMASNQEHGKEIGQMWMLTGQFPGGGVVVDASDGYISIRPGDLIKGRDRLSRSALAKIVSGQGGSSDLDTMAELCASTENDETVMVAMVIATLATPGNASRFQGMQSNPELLRLYGRLNPEQRRQARNGGVEISLTNTPPNLAKSLEKLIFGKNMRLSDSLGAREASSPYIRYGANALEQYSTFSLGNGLPAGSKVRVVVEDNDRLYMRRNGKYGTNDQMTTIDQAASEIAISTSPAMQNQEYYRDNPIAGFGIRNQTELYLEFEFPGAGADREMMYFPKTATDEKFVDADQLPAKWRDKLVPQIAKMREMYKDVQPGRDTAPPPALR